MKINRETATADCRNSHRVSQQKNSIDHVFVPLEVVADSNGGRKGTTAEAGH